MTTKNMTSSDPVIEQRKVFQPFVDVFSAAIAWHKSDSYTRQTLERELTKACEKALADMAQNAIDAYLTTLPEKQQEVSTAPKNASPVVAAPTMPCSMCDGTGYFDQGEVSGRCATCKGTGERRAASEAKGGEQP